MSDTPFQIDFPEGLPVSARRDEIMAAMDQHQVIIVCGETGSGKTTQLPKIALELGRGLGAGGRGLIGHTQPRRLAASSTAKRIAQEVYPHLVGKQHQARLLFNCPSTGDAGAAAHQAMMDLHNGVETAVDYPAPPSLFEPGWYLRQDVIWSKPNAMPESVRDRCTKAHEYVFLLSKSERYYFNFDAVQEPVEGGAHARLPGNRRHKHTEAYEAGDERHRTKAGLLAYSERQRAKQPTPAGWATGDGPHTAQAHQQAGRHPKAAEGVGRRQGPPGNPAERKLAAEGSGTKNNGSFDQAMAVMPDTRNPRSVRWLASEPFSGAHFATYPSELIRPFIAAGCPESGTVLDPFGGSGTTDLEADRQHKNAILIDLDERNLPMATDRIAGDAGLFADVTTGEAA